MTNKSISQLTAGGAVSSTDLFPDVQTVGVGPVRVTAAQIGDYVLSGSGLTGVLPVSRGGTGLSTLTAANYALYSTSASALTAGTLPVAAGGTGLTSLTAGRIPYGDGTNAFGSSSNLFFDGTNLGVGTSTIVQKLTVSNGSISVSDGFGYTFGSSSAYISGNSGSNFINFVTSSSEKMRLDASGNLGIGATSLNARLQFANEATSTAGASNKISLYYGSSTAAFGFGIASGQMTYNCGDGNHVFYTGGNASPVERARIDSSGNVGIGTSSPQFKLNSVQGVGSAAPSLRQAIQIYAKGYGGASTHHAGIGFAMSEHTNGYWGSGILSVDDTGSYGSALAFYTSSGSATPSPSERVRIDSSGNVGIGTSSPGSPLVVQNATANPLIAANATGTQDGAIQLLRSGSLIGALYINNSGEFFIRQHTANNLIFQTNGTERARIDSIGNLLVGATSGSQKLYVSSAAGLGSVAGFVNTTSTGNVSGIYALIGATGNSTSSFHFAGVTDTVNTWYLYGNGTTSYSSDARLKKNIVTTRDGYLDDLIKLRVVKYHWWNNNDDAPKELGLIAQEVEKIFPGLVQDAQHESKDGVKHKVIKHSVMEFILIKAIQELAAKVTALEEQLNG